MKRLWLSLSLLVLLVSMVSSLSVPGAQAGDFNPELAAQTGADDYGMKSYVMAFLKAGPNREGTEAKKAELQRAHLDNIKRLADEGLLVPAGPFLDDGVLRGIYIFNVADIDTAKKLTESDPAIQAGSLVMELHPWYGSAALMQINQLHSQLARKGI
ncbi:YciI family protein [Shewanella sp. GXUN23E]